MGRPKGSKNKPKTAQVAVTAPVAVVPSIVTTIKRAAAVEAPESGLAVSTRAKLRAAAEAQAAEQDEPQHVKRSKMIGTYPENEAFPPAWVGGDCFAISATPSWGNKIIENASQAAVVFEEYYREKPVAPMVYARGLWLSPHPTLNTIWVAAQSAANRAAVAEINAGNTDIPSLTQTWKDTQKKALSQPVQGVGAIIEQQTF